MIGVQLHAKNGRRLGVFEMKWIGQKFLLFIGILKLLGIGQKYGREECCGVVLVTLLPLRLLSRCNNIAHTFLANINLKSAHNQRTWRHIGF
jgi:hypothetical protein